MIFIIIFMCGYDDEFDFLNPHPRKPLPKDEIEEPLEYDDDEEELEYEDYEE